MFPAQLNAVCGDLYTTEALMNLTTKMLKSISLDRCDRLSGPR